MTTKQRNRLSLRRKILRCGFVIGVIGTIFVFLLPSMWTNLFQSQIKLKRDTEFTKSWEQFPVPLTTKFYFFHVLNPEEAMSGHKVKLREVGPFTFDQWRRKEVIEWGPADETVKYHEYKKYIYKPELSDDWDQEITTVNPIVAGLASNLADTMQTIPVAQKVVSPFLYSIISTVLISHGHNLFLKTTPKQLLRGHRINIFDTAAAIVEPLSVFGIKKDDILPSEDLPNNAFGILNGKNDTPTGPFEIYTGQGDNGLSKYTYMTSYKNERKQNKWRNEYCDRIYGTDGAQFPPFRSKKDRLPIFTPDLCRTLHIIFDKEEEFKGIPVWRMKLDPKIFEPPQMNPENECYCMHWKKKKERCGIKGTIDLGGCLKGAPILLSAPHFLGTSPDLSELVEGLRPDKKKHDFFILMEPRIGVPVFAYGRMMLSIRVERTSFLRGFDQVKNAFIPFVWIEESGGVDDFLAMILRIILVYVVDGSVTLFTFLMVVGWIMFFSTLLYGFFCTTGQRLVSEEHLYTRSSKGSSSSRLPHIDSDREDDDDEDTEEGSEEGDALKKSKIKAQNSNSSIQNHHRSHLSKNITPLKPSSPPSLHSPTSIDVTDHHRQRHNSSTISTISTSSNDVEHDVLDIVVKEPLSLSPSPPPTGSQVTTDERMTSGRVGRFFHQRTNMLATRVLIDSASNKKTSTVTATRHDVKIAQTMSKGVGGSGSGGLPKS